MMTEAQKVCSKCGELKSGDEFDRRDTVSRAGWCNVCVADYQRRYHQRYRATHKAERNERDRVARRDAAARRAAEADERDRVARCAAAARDSTAPGLVSHGDLRAQARRGGVNPWNVCKVPDCWRPENSCGDCQDQLDEAR